MVIGLTCSTHAGHPWTPQESRLGFQVSKDKSFGWLTDMMSAGRCDKVHRRVTAVSIWIV